MTQIVKIAIIMAIAFSTSCFGYTMAPDGSYVGGSTYTMAPDGSYVGGTGYSLAPNGKYIGNGR